jgi:integrase
MTPNGFLYRWKRLLQHVRLAHCGPHALRHTWASILIARNENLLYIRDQLGHSSIKIMMDNYGHLMRQSGKAGVAKLDDEEWDEEEWKRNSDGTTLLRVVTSI